MSFRLEVLNLSEPQYFLRDSSIKEICDAVLADNNLIRQVIEGFNKGVFWKDINADGVETQNIIWINSHGAIRKRVANSDVIESRVQNIPDACLELTILPNQHQEPIICTDLDNPDWLIVYGAVFVVCGAEGN